MFHSLPCRPCQMCSTCWLAAELCLSPSTLPSLLEAPELELELELVEGLEVEVEPGLPSCSRPSCLSPYLRPSRPPTSVGCPTPS